MPASAAQVFGPVTVDPGFNTTGEKTLLTMATTLPAGSKNVILVAIAFPYLDMSGGDSIFRIYKGSTLLYETKILDTLSAGSRHKLVIAVDNSPSGNDTYYVKINITTVGSRSGNIHVQGIVIKADDAIWGYNTTAVSIASGATATVVSISTNFPAGSKVALVGVLYGSWPGSANALIGAGNYRLKGGATILASNQFAQGAWQSNNPAWVSLCYLDSPASATQVYSLEVYNNSGYTYNFYGEIVAFTVFDGAFLDTASVALTNGSQVTVGNLTTSLSGNMVVIALAAFENTSGSFVTAFNSGDIVLQKDNSTTDQIASLIGWVLAPSTYHSRSGILPMFRFDENVSNPTYQVKMTARASGINGEAKILAFSTAVVVSVTDSGVGVETVSVAAQAFATDSSTGSETINLQASLNITDLGLGIETISMTKEAIDAGAGVDFTTAGINQSIDDAAVGSETIAIQTQIPASDTGVGSELINMRKEAFDTGAGVETVNSPRFNVYTDAGTGVDAGVIIISRLDSGVGVETITMSKEVLDSGAGVEAITFMLKEMLDTGSGIEQATIRALMSVIDAGTGVDTALLAGIIVAITDTGTSAELVETFLSIFGDIFVDGVEIIGRHSIPYHDLVRDGLPIQTQRRAVDDKVYVDSVEVGTVLVEWEDKVADVMPGTRTLHVIGVVRLVD